MKKAICLIAVLCVCFAINANAKASPSQEMIDATNNEWIAYQGIQNLWVSMPDVLDSSLHCLWDIPFGVDVDTFIAKMQKNANMDGDIAYTTSDVYLTLKNSKGNLLFDYPILQSYFGIYYVPQSLGLSASTSSSGGKYAYQYAALRLGRSEANETLSDAAKCFAAVFNGVTDAYGPYTNIRYRTTNAKAYVSPDIFTQDGAINAERIEACLQADEDAAGRYLHAIWGNVTLELRYSAYPKVTLSFAPTNDDR